MLLVKNYVVFVVYFLPNMVKKQILCNVTGFFRSRMLKLKVELYVKNMHKHFIVHKLGCYLYRDSTMYSVS